jgi:hypothetical protein
MAAYATQSTESVPSGVAAQAAATLTRNQVMTAREVAEMLRMPTSTVYELARKACSLRRSLVVRGGSYVRGSKSFLPAELAAVRPLRRAHRRVRRG